jgi:L-amino acid N-acyltransferase YncA
MEIIKMLSHHWEDVKKIYEEGIKTGNATFQTAALRNGRNGIIRICKHAG